MKKFFTKIRGERGFTLTEVLIGISILAVAIVSATNLLITSVESNKNNVKTLQAFYYAQEGIEAFRNIRDTNWLHNQDWLAGDTNRKIWMSGFTASQEGTKYEIVSNDRVFNMTVLGDRNVDAQGMNVYAPWQVHSLNAENDAQENENGLKRVISVYSYDCNKGLNIEECNDYVKVVSKVFWMDSGSEKKVELNEIFTNWKGGAL